MPLAIGVIAAVALLAWSGVELDHVVRQYPGQFFMGCFAVLFIAVAAGIARFKADHRPVVIARPVPSLPKAIPAVPVRTAVAAPHDEDARPCDGPACRNKVDDDPWTARVPGDARERVFCSQECARGWQASLSHPV
jgi:hypothetical protein